MAIEFSCKLILCLEDQCGGTDHHATLCVSFHSCWLRSNNNKHLCQPTAIFATATSRRMCRDLGRSSNFAVIDLSCFECNSPARRHHLQEQHAAIPCNFTSQHKSSQWADCVTNTSQSSKPLEDPLVLKLEGVCSSPLVLVWQISSGVDGLFARAILPPPSSGGHLGMMSQMNIKTVKLSLLLACPRASNPVLNQPLPEGAAEVVDANESWASPKHAEKETKMVSSSG